MAGGYAIPEFGLAYVRDIRIVEEKSKKARKADMLVSACYCMDHEQLYENPQSHGEVSQSIFPLSCRKITVFHDILVVSK